MAERVQVFRFHVDPTRTYDGAALAELSAEVARWATLYRISDGDEWATEEQLEPIAA